MQDDKPTLFRHINPPVFFIASALIFLAVLLTAMFPVEAEEVFKSLQDGVVARFGWLYVLAVAVFLVFGILLAGSSFGDLTLGSDSEPPEFSYLTWIAMLFSAGMGIGLMFFGVAEPITHYANPPGMEGGTPEAARAAMEISFFHWGIHAWAIYGLVGLSLAYFGFRRGLPLTLRSSLFPLIGERIHGWPGHLVDVLAVLGTMFGVATSLGFGVMQVNAGLGFLFDVPVGLSTQIVLIALITLAATISVVTGLDKGIRRISELNLIIAVLLLVFVLAVGPTQFLLRAFVENLGLYLGGIVEQTFQLFAYEPTEWVGEWTLFYWAWWISWSPFVGMFIARVSRGRTLREFIVGVLLIPSAFTFMWMTVFGNGAILADVEVGGEITRLVGENMPVALFSYLDTLPLSQLVSGLATLLVITFFVTSSDSGSLVIDIITSGGAAEPPVWQRVFWAVTEGVVAAVLLTAGGDDGLTALQAASLTTALPFALVLLAICYGLFRGLKDEQAWRRSHRVVPSALYVGSELPWKDRLKAILRHPGRRGAETFLREVAQPAIREVASELRKQGLVAELISGDDYAGITVNHGGAERHAFDYTIYLRGYAEPDFAYPEFHASGSKGSRIYRAEVHQTEGGEPYNVLGLSKDALIADILSHYERHIHYLHLAH